MPLSDVMEKATLDWVTGGASPTRPPNRWIQFATTSPTSQSAFDGPISPRVTVSFAAANSPQMSATNLNALSLATATAAMTAVGWNLYDSNVGGTRLAYGTLTAVIGCKSADNIQINAGGLVIVLS